MTNRLAQPWVSGRFCAQKRPDFADSDSRPYVHGKEGEYFKSVKTTFAGFSCILLLIAGLISSIQSFSQGFENVTTENFINVMNDGSEFGNGLSFVDFDQDGWDDLSFATSSGEPVFYKNESGSFFQIELGLGMDENSDVKAIQWVDYDNDGDHDLFLTLQHEPVRLFENTGDLNFVDVTEEAGFVEEFVRHYGASWADYDKDGDLDVYLCKYHNPVFSWGYEFKNHLYRNNGDGTFTDVTEEAGVSDNIKASFQSAFFDYDGDGFEDLYVINDRLNYSNTMFKNNGDGTFTNVTEETNTGVIIDAMTLTVGDFDRDEDLDIYITDNYSNVLLQNNGDGTFTNVAEEYGVVVGHISWAALWLDYDNNMTEDLLVACVNNFGTINFQNHFFENELTQFTCIHDSIGLSDDDFGTFSLAMGDTNNDGYPDFLENNQTTATCQLWQNTGGTNNWLKVDLEGVVSNKGGVGSWIKVYTDSIVQTRYVHLGESYLSQASTKEMIGLGNFAVVDSLEVSWPSGLIDKLYNVEPNNTLEIEEGQTYTSQILAMGSTEICEGDSVQLTLSSADEYYWSDGFTGQSQYVAEEGEYYAELIIDGLAVNTDTIEVSFLPPPAVQPSVEHVSCHGGSDGLIILENFNGAGINQVVWTNEMQGDTLSGLSQGNYQYELTDNNGCSITGLVSVNQPSELVAEIETTNETESEDGNALLNISGGTPPYFIEWSNGEINEIFIDQLPAGEYTVEVVDSNGCSVSISFVIDEFTGVHENSVEPISIYPNPTDKRIFIKAEKTLSIVCIFTLTGQSVLKRENISAEEAHRKGISISHLNPGPYILEITESHTPIRFKIIKE